jgi:glutamyl-tRNA synthetase
MTVAGRFAPSPSGRMHLGNARTALLAWLDARSRGGRMVLRIEDLDRDRCRPEYADALRDDLRWLGLDWDAETTPQSRRGPVYDAAIDGLRARGLVYECFCTRRDVAIASAPHGPGEEPRGCPRGCAQLRPGEVRRRIDAGERAALRVRLPDAAPAVVDRLHGPIDQPTGEWSDVVVRRSDGLHAYHLAVVVDDAADGVTDVVRGDDLLGVTPRQAALAGLLDLSPPAYAHVPLLVGHDGTRLAKRHGAVSIAEVRRLVGPEALVASLARSAGITDARAARPSDLLGEFALERIDRRPVVVRGDVSGFGFVPVSAA